MDWQGRLRGGRGTAVGNSMEGSQIFPNGQRGLDQGLHRQAWLGTRQLPGTHQHRPFWGVSCVPKGPSRPRVPYTWRSFRRCLSPRC